MTAQKPAFQTTLTRQLSTMSDRALLGAASAALAVAARRQLFTLDEAPAIAATVEALRQATDLAVAAEAAAKAAAQADVVALPGLELQQ